MTPEFRIRAYCPLPNKRAKLLCGFKANMQLSGKVFMAITFMNLL
jgi:hypothetical protein